MKVVFVCFLALVLAQNQVANQTGAALPNVAAAVANAAQQVSKETLQSDHTQGNIYAIIENLVLSSMLIRMYFLYLMTINAQK